MATSTSTKALYVIAIAADELDLIAHAAELRAAAAALMREGRAVVASGQRSLTPEEAAQLPMLVTAFAVNGGLDASSVGHILVSPPQQPQ